MKKILLAICAGMALLVCSCKKEADERSYLFDVVEGRYSLGEYIWYGSPGLLDIDDSGYATSNLMTSFPRISGGYYYDSEGNIIDRIYSGNLHITSYSSITDNGSGYMTIPIIRDSETEDRTPRNVSIAELNFRFQINGDSMVFSDTDILPIHDTGHLSTLLSEPKMEYEYSDGVGHVKVECKASFYDYTTKSDVEGTVRLRYDYNGVQL